MFPRSLTRLIQTTINPIRNNEQLLEGFVSLGLIGINHQYQQLRCKSKIKFCGYIEPPAFKKRDLRYKTSTVHDPKRMSWHDYQFRSWKALHWNKPYPYWQAKMDYAENLCRLGMSNWAIYEITKLHPYCIDYIKRKLSGNIELLREAEYSNYFNHRLGDR
ncbi:hypothetical protein SSS_03256 [Sarcoptes scabiei]|uniref:Uncharacterized protein n=1 Tax=Sarcoptes scabiei TaxID=52283 RepID=A0A834R065_SARSC|nr:hypothetical protein SSS_03256 [Sarcoptes scabiei]